MPVTLNLAYDINSSAHYAKGTPSQASTLPINQRPHIFLNLQTMLTPALTACRRTVSGSVSLPSRGAFHLSLTVLLLYRSVGVFSLGEWSPLIHTGFHVPGTTWDRSSAPAPFGYRTVTFFGIPSQRFLLNAFRLSGWAQPPLERPPTPKTQRPRA